MMSTTWCFQATRSVSLTGSFQVELCMLALLLLLERHAELGPSVLSQLIRANRATQHYFPHVSPKFHSSGRNPVGPITLQQGNSVGKRLPGRFDHCCWDWPRLCRGPQHFHSPGRNLGYTKHRQIFMCLICALCFKFYVSKFQLSLQFVLFFAIPEVMQREMILTWYSWTWF